MAYSKAKLIAPVHQFEDNFVARKTVSDRKEWFKIAVAFANSTPEARGEIFFIGVTDSGAWRRAQWQETIHRLAGKTPNFVSTTRVSGHC
jgi:predicted HTH transcriptional regulator